MYFFIISEVNTLGALQSANSVRGLKCDGQESVHDRQGPTEQAEVEKQL